MDFGYYGGYSNPDERCRGNNSLYAMSRVNVIIQR